MNENQCVYFHKLVDINNALTCPRVSVFLESLLPNMFKTHIFSRW